MAAHHVTDRGARGWYLYGIVPSDVELTGEARGVGNPPAPIQLVRSGDIAALVSEVDLAQPLGSPDDLRAHQQLLDATSAEAPVLPLRFGAVLTDRDAVAEELLTPYHDQFAAALTELEGHAQYVVKGRYIEQALLREVIADDPQAARLRDEIRAIGDEDASRNLRIQLGEIISQAVTAKREEDTRRLGDVLAPYCTASNVREPTHEQDAAHVAVLVETARQQELERAVDHLEDDWRGRITLRLLGPMAPYDFVSAPSPEG